MQGWKGNAFLHSSHCKGVSEHMRGHRAVDVGFVGNAFEDELNGAGCLSNGVMDSKVSVNQWAYTVSEGNGYPLKAGQMGVGQIR